jgi:4-hydroxy-3-polyprenylbenzoate decarboxylase
MIARLGDFIELLERGGQLVRIGCEVDSDQEIAAITARVAREGGPALFFENVQGRRTPVATNLLGSEERVRLALGVAKLDDVIGLLSKPAASPSGWLARLKGNEQGSQAPRVVKMAGCQQVVRLGRDVDLAAWPALRSWPGEAQPSITAGRLLTVDSSGEPVTFAVTASIVDRAQLSLTIDLPLHAFQPKVRTPAAIVLGGEPAAAIFTSAAARPLAAFDLPAMLRNRGADLAKCRTHDVYVPAEAEIVIEGFVEPASAQQPASNLAAETGYYAPLSSAWPMEVTAITHRTNPIFPATVVAAPPSEASVIRGVIARWLRPLLAQAVPEMVDYHLPNDAGPHQFAVVSIRKTHAQQARKVMAACWGLEWLTLTKMLVVVDEHVDVRDGRAVLQAMGANVDGRRDVIPWQGPAWTGDHAADDPNAGTHVGIDATAKLPGESTRPWPARLVTDEAIAELVAKRWKEYGVQ